MNNLRYIEELESFSSENSILIITTNGKLIRLFTPAIARCILPIGDFKPGFYTEITAFKISKDLKLVYRIENKSFYHSYFELIHAE